MSKKLINGLKYEKLTEDQLYDLSQWELVDIILAYREDLKAKEQECEAYKMEADEGKEINAELKAENEELITINARLLGRLEVDETDTSLVFNLDKELRQKEKEFYTAIQKVVKLKQTLAEIKEIAQVNSINTCWTAINLCADCDEIKECGLQSPFEKLKAIIQIISEVEDAW